MQVRPLDAKNIDEATIAAEKQGKLEGNTYTDNVEFGTSKETDQKIFFEVNTLANSINSGETEYNLFTMNCADAVVNPIEKATNVELSDKVKPNSSFREIKDNKDGIQNNLNNKEDGKKLKSGKAHPETIPSGMDNIPTSTRPVVVQNLTTTDKH
jgi:hypothetical protein